MVSPLIISLKKHKNFCGSEIKVLSPAKINLYLNIKGKYPNGFHRLESIVERISLSDEISIKTIKAPIVEVSSNIKSLETDDNLIVKAVQLIRKKFKIPFGFNIFLKKVIPIGAGLGGGSSNAASTLIGLNKLFNLKLRREELYLLGKRLGSDVNFFLSQSQFAFLEGRGEKVTPLAIKKKFSHFIIWPGIFISTKKVYSGMRVHPVRSKTSNGVELTNFFNNDNIMRYALKKEDISLIRKNVFNALEKRALSLYAELRLAKMHLDECGIFAKVTGSGSAFYTVGDISSLSKVKRLVPKEWEVFKVNTF
ncbi:MAG: 4-(cytidine 5'-diphospho)-2-C-methyl-D-erythritol kinase [Candidatus Omnitrophica bacterium]|nr:4-(cytidine 5'-diphospho)-2-C-methyl-D-erythritol kinase [Candidatus Omnitrophota bacterium]